jgi:hypothetical protein
LSGRASETGNEVLDMLGHGGPFAIAPGLNFEGDIFRDVLRPVLKRIEGDDARRESESSLSDSTIQSTHGLRAKVLVASWGALPTVAMAGSSALPMRASRHKHCFVPPQTSLGYDRRCKPWKTGLQPWEAKKLRRSRPYTGLRLRGPAGSCPLVFTTALVSSPY